MIIWIWTTRQDTSGSYSYWEKCYYDYSLGGINYTFASEFREEVAK
jgi:hypothetical protein